MRGTVILFVVAVVAGFGVDTGCCFGESVDRQYPLGTIGCLITKTLCGPDEECVDDLLFGNCQKARELKNYYEYRPNREILQSLELEIISLIELGHSWQDPYTQCVLQNMLASYRSGEGVPTELRFIKELCSQRTGDGTEDWSSNVSNEIKNVLLQLYEWYSNAGKESRDLPDLGYDIQPSEKRDEIVQVHKYFDESATPFKRRLDPQPDSDQELYKYLYNLASDVSPEEPTYSSEDAARDDITLDDLQELRALLQPTTSEEGDDGLYSRLDDSLYPDGGDVSNIPPLKKAEVGEELEYSPDAQNPGWMWVQEPDDAGSLDKASEVEASIESPDLSVESSEKLTGGDILDNSKDLMDPATNNYLTISPPDAKLLLELLQGTSEPKSMNNEQLDRMIIYINALLTAYGIQDDNVANTDLTSSQEVRGIVDPGFDLEESSLGNSDADFDTASSVQAKILAPEELQQPIVETKKAIFNDDEDKDKDKDDYSPAREESSHFDVVDANYIILTMANPVSQDTAEEVIRTLEDILQVPSGSFEVQQVQDEKIRFLVDPQAAGMNATIVSSQIDGLKHDLEKATGLQILSYTLEGEDKIQLINHDAESPKYFVLTFVLCGSIAGILLAVVIIYLIKRHARSKEKLSRLAAEGGGLEASQDYQDLCRQRMQSKTSEKPEPLHAASRVSSVQSESQVRSPSSRSSTSSWSEEPVASNMDISTGHIVLSYMEDHLKNKDRLDREWEALCSYEADPNSTKMAVDPANMRKNRYSDLLPYDHSRVILTDTTNVSGSDYINASTITDHDPRNPAYISTQGPLPHTVADFWQLIWEQGSVVIVMLTKLTENGEAMCHRYWPEEGSDLYHIYEVHLVSEHIWCDDYLVRSFYLKNLQTNETRTVTQFHFLSWPELSVPSSVKALLEFRRKVNKSYRGRSCPIVVHCSDGCGRAGTYSVIDMVLNRMAKGAKEIDIAATLEHIRDQRMLMVKTKEQFQFALAAVAEEVHAILKALPQ